MGIWEFIKKNDYQPTRSWKSYGQSPIANMSDALGKYSPVLSAVASGLSIATGIANVVSNIKGKQESVPIDTKIPEQTTATTTGNKDSDTASMEVLSKLCQLIDQLQIQNEALSNHQSVEQKPKPEVKEQPKPIEQKVEQKPQPKAKEQPKPKEQKAKHNQENNTDIVTLTSAQIFKNNQDFGIKYPKTLKYIDMAKKKGCAIFFTLDKKSSNISYTMFDKNYKIEEIAVIDLSEPGLPVPTLDHKALDCLSGDLINTCQKCTYDLERLRQLGIPTNILHTIITSIGTLDIYEKYIQQIKDVPQCQELLRRILDVINTLLDSYRAIAPLQDENLITWINNVKNVYEIYSKGLGSKN